MSLISARLRAMRSFTLCKLPNRIVEKQSANVGAAVALEPANRGNGPDIVGSAVL
jgi:hypothetical protein